MKTYILVFNISGLFIDSVFYECISKDSQQTNVYSTTVPHKLICELSLQLLVMRASWLWNENSYLEIHSKWQLELHTGPGVPYLLILLFNYALSTGKFHSIICKLYNMNGQFEGLWMCAVMTSLAHRNW